MATRELMAILLGVGDTVLWGVPDPEPITIKKIHYSDPIPGKLRIETDRTPDIRVSCRTLFIWIKEP